MLDPFDFENRTLREKLGRKRALAFVVLGFERFQLASWRLICWFLLFAALWLIDIPTLFGTSGLITAFLIFVCGTGFFIWKDLRHFRFPSRHDIDRRLELDSGLAHRPVSSLDDTLANTENPQTRGLWISGKMWMLGALKHLHKPVLRRSLAEKDPYAIRLGIVMFFLIGLGIAGPQTGARLSQGLMPFHFRAAEKPGERISLWITAPEYTHAKQIVLSGHQKLSEAVKIPEGSSFKIRVSGGFGHPVLISGDHVFPLKKLGGHSYGTEGIIPSGKLLRVSQAFIPQAHWAYSIIPDEAPAIALKAQPDVMENSQIRVPLTVYDDYGVRDITMHMSLDPMVGDAPVGEPVTETRTVMSPSGSAEIQPLYDLSWHSWAGLPVILDFSISDAKGQIATLAPIKLVLPERHFRHPVAQKIIALRKKLAWDAVSSAAEVSDELQNLLVQPGEFQNDIVTFLSIRSASSRLYYNPPHEVVKNVIALLWDVALRIEDGNLTLAQNHLREAQQALQDALNKPETTPEEISRLMDKLKGAMAEYMAEMQKELQKRIANGEPIPIIPQEMASAALNPAAIGRFLEEMESHMRNGEKGDAQKMLSQLQRMMDTLGAAMGLQLPPDVKFMNSGIHELQQLIEKQQMLLDKTSKQIGTDGQDQTLEATPPAPKSVNTQDSKAEQEALRYVLGQIMLDADKALGSIPDNLSKAELEMRLSSESLGKNDPTHAAPHQQQVLNDLKQSMKQMSQQMMQRLEQMGGISVGRMRFDPLGRPMSEGEKDQGLFPGSNVKIPEESEKKRVERILETLRQRSGELERPPAELEYYRRLLHQF